MRVAIIGAGASGLVMGRYIKDLCLEFDIYERRNCIGGNWRDREPSGSLPDEDVLACSPLYDLLRTNTPIDAVKFEDLDYDLEECFIHWSEVNKYLKNYSDKFGLNEHIFLDTEVINVSWTNDNKWKINSRNNLNGKTDEKLYNFLIVCNGHEEYPKIPDYEGLSEFKGIKLHSKKYRNPKHYKNQRVLVIGVGPSGSDIALQLLSEADTVYFSHHKDFSDGRYPSNLVQKPDVKKFTQNSVIFEDDTDCEMDAVIFCTGYVHNIDFLDKSCGVELGDKYIRKLYKQMISIEHPSLIFIGYCRLFFIFPLVEWQAKVAAKVVAGQVALPSTEEMFAVTKAWEENKRNEGKQERQFFELKSLARSYMRELSEVGDLEYPEEALFEMFDTYFYNFKHHPTIFKKHYYRIINSKFIYKPCTEFNSS